MQVIGSSGGNGYVLQLHCQPAVFLTFPKAASGNYLMELYYFVSAISESGGFEIFLLGLVGHGRVVDELTFPLYMLDDCEIS